MNGFGQAFAALGRMIGPIIGSPLFAWSENSGKYTMRVCENLSIHFWYTYLHEPDLYGGYIPGWLFTCLSSVISFHKHDGRGPEP